MADTAELLLSSLQRSIVDVSAQQASAALANHTTQINNHARSGEYMSKTMVEVDPIQALSVAEANTRFSPASQAYGHATNMGLEGSALQNNQNFITQAFSQFQNQMNAMQMQLNMISQQKSA